MVTPQERCALISDWGIRETPRKEDRTMRSPLLSRAMMVMVCCMLRLPFAVVSMSVSMTHN